ncbi:ABC transporter ATP-binding protein [Myxococcota bacterium]|nr:ABC transporter ATP-binding protein [Myxococcota bacterium]MBU1537503.1 ABC transporter ATP-binding protein [Myxococcota bacterium]
MVKTLLHFTNLSLAAGDVPLLRDLTGSIPRGKMVAIAGASGAGKTTLLRCLSGLNGGFTGSINFLDQPMEQWSARRMASHRSYLPQNEQVSAGWSCLDVVQLGLVPIRDSSLRNALTPAAGDLALIEEVLALTGLSVFSHRLFHTLSGGEKRRILFARALLQNRDIMFLDEPTAFFDPGQALRFWNLLSEIHTKSQSSIVVVTHDLQAILNSFQEVLLLHRGSLMATGDPKKVLTEHGEKAFGVSLSIGEDPSWGCFIKTRGNRHP